MIDTVSKGREGENDASAYLVSKGYRILERQFRTQGGEVDIVCIKRESIVFVEVKAWSVYGVEDLERSVGPEKRDRIRSAASLFLKKHPEFSGFYVRFDLIFLSRRSGELNHWENAF